jgi:uncharacterized protein YacL
MNPAIIRRRIVFIGGGFMDFERFLRLIGMVVLGIAGWRLGMDAARMGLDSRPAWQFALAFALAGAILGLVLTPWLTIRPAAMIRQVIRPIPLQQLLAGTAGLILGLIMAGLVSYPLSLLPDPLGRVLPSLGAVFFGYLGLTVAGTRYKDLLALLPRHLRERDGEHAILLDTSVIIDGRIADVARTGFIQATLLVPRFVLNELQHIADSQDPLRRNRGRRGLEILNRMQKEGHVPIRIVDMEVEGREVDEKLIALARRLRCPIMTNDYNLNRVAELQNVRVLNINELANAVRTILLPGDRSCAVGSVLLPTRRMGYHHDGGGDDADGLPAVPIRGASQNPCPDGGLRQHPAAGRRLRPGKRQNRHLHDHQSPLSLPARAASGSPLQPHLRGDPIRRREVDEKLIALARRLRCPIMTNDYNLNRVAELQNVRVLNINELANAVRTILLPGETLTLPIIQEGKEPGQGVGYLEDGTMVVVEEGRRYIGREIPVVVTKVLQTAAGRMIFARPEEPARSAS